MIESVKSINNVCGTLIYFEESLFFVSAVSGCVSTSVFASLLGVPARIANSTVGLKFFPITAGIKKYKSIIEKRRRSIIK